MSKELTEKIIEKAKDTFDQMDVMVGYCQGSNPLKVSPCFIEKKEDLDKLIFNKLCINNLATYAYKLSKEVKGSIGMVLKPCDAKAVVQLVSEGLIERDRFKLLTVGCSGVIDYKKVLKKLDGARVLSADIGTEKVEVVTAEGKKSLKTKDLYAEKCYWCGIYGNPPASDEFVESKDKLDVDKKDRYGDIKELEKLSLDDIYAYWEEEFSRCIRCYACRNVCPLEVCQDQCIVHLDYPNWQSQKSVPSENKFFQLIRVMHLAGRCVECGECERVCPQNISLLKMMKKMNQQIEELFGFVPGTDAEKKPPLLTYKTVEENIEEEELI
ncbi:MAG: 4Fe-4S dicluster domain-containing protein [Actinomycetota bacterium]